MVRDVHLVRVAGPESEAKSASPWRAAFVRDRCGVAERVALVGVDGRPVSVGQIREGDELAVLHIDKSRVPLSSSVKDPAVYPVVEAALGIPIARYALA